MLKNKAAFFTKKKPMQRFHKNVCTDGIGGDHVIHGVSDRVGATGGTSPGPAQTERADRTTTERARGEKRDQQQVWARDS